MTTIDDCYAGVCPCSQPERPPAGHQCPSDGLTDAEREERRDAELNRPYESDEGLTASYEIRGLR